jgi:hypothetical protein
MSCCFVGSDMHGTRDGNDWDLVVSSYLLTTNEHPFGFQSSFDAHLRLFCQHLYGFYSGLAS